MSNVEYAGMRRRRVKRLKRMLLGAIFTVITIPIALCILLWSNLTVTNKKLLETENVLAEMTAQYESQLQITEDYKRELDNLNNLAYVTAENIEQEQLGSDLKGLDEYVIRADEPRKVYLTFDDGPSIYTEKILDILDSYGVKATFFVTGQDANHPERYKMIVDRGHAIGIHTYSHVYSQIYSNKNNFIADFQKLKTYIEDNTGVTPTLYRFPGGSSNTVSRTDMDELCDYVESQGFVYFDWNVSSGDATNPMPSASRIISNSVDSLGGLDTAIILMHDTGAKYSTVQALPQIVERIQAMPDTVILPISNDTEIIQHRIIYREEN